MRRLPTRIKISGGYTDEEYLEGCPVGSMPPTVLPPVKRIIAMGDIHGDLEVAVKMFKVADLIDNDYNWIAEPRETVVVQVGDQIDSCRPIPGRHSCDVPSSRPEDNQADDLRVMRFFDEMHQKAVAQGGAVYSLLGNHELLNAKGVMNYVSYADGHQFSYRHADLEYTGLEGRRRAFAPGGPLARAMACSRISILIIGSTLFAHAGILPSLAKRFDFDPNLSYHERLRYVNILVSKWLMGSVLKQHEEMILKLVRDGADSPFWNRILGDIPTGEKLDGEACRDVKDVLETYRIGSMVIGHTPQFIKNEKINGTCRYAQERRDAVYRVDGGYSKSFFAFTQKMTTVSVLEILDDQHFQILTEHPDVEDESITDVYAR